MNRAHCRCCRLCPFPSVSLILSFSFLTARSEVSLTLSFPARSPTYLFLSPSLVPFLPRLLLHFCPFARFLLPQTTAAYLYPVFASRSQDRARVLSRPLATTDVAAVIVVVVAIAADSRSILSFILFFEMLFRDACVTYVTLSH